MTRDDLKEWESKLMEAVVLRRQLGDFDTNSKVIRLGLECQLELVRHLIAGMPRPRAKDE